MRKALNARERNDWKTEYDVVSTLRACGHDVRPLGVQHELRPIREAVEEFKPHVVFNLLEQFHGETAYDQNVASYLELLRIPYTGCNPRGLMLARGKDLVEEAADLPPHSGAGFRGLSAQSQGEAAGAAQLSADRQKPQRGCFGRYRPGLARQATKNWLSAWLLSTSVSARILMSNTSTVAKYMSAYWATIGCGYCRSGSSISAACRKAPAALPPCGSSTTSITRNAVAFCRAQPKACHRNCRRA